MPTTAEILKDSLLLPEDERTALALALLDSIDAPDPHGHLDDAEFSAEIARRATKAAAGDGDSSSWEEVRARIERNLKK